MLWYLLHWIVITESWELAKVEMTVHADHTEQNNLVSIRIIYSAVTSWPHCCVVALGCFTCCCCYVLTVLIWNLSWWGEKKRKNFEDSLSNHHNHHHTAAHAAQSSQSTVCIRLWSGMGCTTHSPMNLNTQHVCVLPCTERSHNTAELRGPEPLLPDVSILLLFFLQSIISILFGTYPPLWLLLHSLSVLPHIALYVSVM